MRTIKTKSMENIEQKMQEVDADSVRYHTLESAKNFKSSWIELGRALRAVWKDKKYKEWGYTDFELYTKKEIGIKKQTAIKLLRSYFFLEKEEPQFLTKEYVKSSDAAAVPNYESVNLLRLAKKKNTLDNEDYTKLREDVFIKGKQAQDIKKDITSLIRQRQELEPEEAREKQRIQIAKRFLGTLKSLQRELKSLKLLTAPTIKQMSDLITKLEIEIGS